ncbi:MAG: hypothetical protein HJJLKODD_02263 [Phycisphaerae bacterium]|nr:hypothetical protein [Phycisphaerae bacterium]
MTHSEISAGNTSARRNNWFNGILLIMGVIIVFGLLIPFDLPLARQLQSWAPPNAAHPLHYMLVIFRLFGEFSTWAGVILIIALFETRRRLLLSSLLLSIFISWAGYSSLKRFVPRLRPNSEIVKNHQIDTWMETWSQAHRTLSGEAIRSFPSGHTASAWTLAIVLSIYYPRARWVCWCLAMGCGLSRIIEAWHWTTDCWAGGWWGGFAAWMGCRIARIRPPPSA